jgi:hypothetical protein
MKPEAERRPIPAVPRRSTELLAGSRGFSLAFLILAAVAPSPRHSPNAARTLLPGYGTLGRT